jgi:hypothetical protein
MLRALRSEIGGDADIEAVLAASGGDVNPAAAPWHGRAATIGLLQERLRAAQAAAGQVCMVLQPSHVNKLHVSITNLPQMRQCLHLPSQTCQYCCFCRQQCKKSASV